MNVPATGNDASKNPGMKKTPVSLLLLALLSSAHAEMRVWTNSNGSVLTAELIAMDDITVTLHDTGGKTFMIPRATLSGPDLAFLRTATLPPAKLAFDEGGRTLPQLTGSHVVISGQCNLEGAVVKLSGTLSGTSKVIDGRWDISIPQPLDGWAKGTVTFVAEAARAGRSADAKMTLNFVNPLDEGALGDGTTDDTAAIYKAAGRAMKQENGIVLLPPGKKFAYKAMITLSGVQLLGSGPTSCLYALDPMSSALAIKGRASTVRNLTLECNLGTTTRRDKGWQTMLFLDGAEDFWVDAVTIANSPSAGIMNYGGHGSPEKYSRITRCVVKNTLADAIHNTANAHHVWIEGNLALDNGDDGYAVVSYGTQRCHDIAVVRNSVRGGHARGVAVIGGEDVLIADNTIADMRAAGIIVGSEWGYKTNSVRGVIVRGNKITGSPSGLPAHGAIFIEGRKDFEVTDVSLEGNWIENSPQSGIRVSQHSNQIRMTGNQISGVKGAGILLKDGNDVTISENSVRRAGDSGIFIESPVRGTCLIQGNRIEEVNVAAKPENAAIRVLDNANGIKLEITDNRYKSGKTTVAKKIVCNVVQAVIKGNQ